jgi:cytoskeletal protein CcmA (bactofilin family)
MFTQGSKSADNSGQIAPSGAGRTSGEPSVISADLKIVGDLHCAGDVQIKGTVEGDIRSRTVTVGEGAQVTGAIYGQAVHVSGSVTGQIEAPTVTVARSGRIEGDVVHESLAVEAGAHLVGSCRRLDSKATASQAGAPALKLSTTGQAAQAAEPNKRAAGGSGA